MRTAAVVLMLASVITFRSCDEAEGHAEVELWLDPLYTGEIVYLTPVITYEGSDQAEFEFNHTVAEVTRVEDEEGVIFQIEDSEREFFIQEVLQSGEEIQGNTLEIDLQPGIYEVHIAAEYSLKTEEETGFREYDHRIQQKIDIR